MFCITEKLPKWPVNSAYITHKAPPPPQHDQSQDVDYRCTQVLG